MSGAAGAAQRAACHESGGRAVLITPHDPDVDILDRIDAIIFSGGSDVDPGLYGEPAHPTTHVKPERDKAELMLLRLAVVLARLVTQARFGPRWRDCCQQLELFRQ